MSRPKKKKTKAGPARSRKRVKNTRASRNLAEAEGREKKEPKLAWDILLAFLVLTVVFVISFLIVLGYNLVYQHSVFPGVKVGQVDLGGQEFLEAVESVGGPLEKIFEDGISLSFNDDQLDLKFSRVSFDIDASYDIFTYDASKTVEQAYAVGRGKDVLTNLKEQLVALISSWQISPDYYLNEEEIVASLEEHFDQYETPHQNAELIVLEDLSFDVREEKIGQAFNYQETVDRIKAMIQNLKVNNIELELQDDPPLVKKAEAQLLSGEVERIWQQAPLAITYGEKSWEVPSEEFATWLAFRVDDSSGQENGIRIGLNEGRVSQYLERLKKEVDIPVQEGKFAMEEGRVVEFQASHSGRELDVESTAYYLDTVIVQGGLDKARIIVTAIEPEITTENVNDLGIKELVGEGISNFSGSPTNRRKNIALGAEKLHGILVRPEEEFSLLKALGEFTAEEGWLPELVIKENKTIPEYGGGACQFGTTMFRLALNAGLPITARANHSYTVSYYNPIGTDATIYDPAPDLKFVNDTGSWLLLQTEIDGNNLIFRFYGTLDGRKIEMTDPVLSNWVSAPPQANIETTDLAPGETKCTERAHSGVTAEFIYTVTYPDSEAVETVFTSKYKPWQAVCLVGVEELSNEEEPADTEEPEEDNKKNQE